MRVTRRSSIAIGRNARQLPRREDLPGAPLESPQHLTSSHGGKMLETLLKQTRAQFELDAQADAASGILHTIESPQ